MDAIVCKCRISIAFDLKGHIHLCKWRQLRHSAQSKCCMSSFQYTCIILSFSHSNSNVLYSSFPPKICFGLFGGGNYMDLSYRKPTHQQFTATFSHKGLQCLLLGGCKLRFGEAIFLSEKPSNQKQQLRINKMFTFCTHVFFTFIITTAMQVSKATKKMHELSFRFVMIHKSERRSFPFKTTALPRFYDS